MKVTFVYADIVLGSSWSGAYSTGVASLSAVMKKAGHETSLIHVTRPISGEELASRVQREAPDLLAFSTTSSLFPYVREWSQKAKASLGITSICGGIHATLAPEDAISCEGIDLVCEGEGEETLLETCERLEKKKPLSGIRGLWTKQDQEVRKPEPRPMLRDLDALPHPDRSIFEYRKLNLVNQGRGIVMASRGCPFECTYCCNHALKKHAGEGVPYVRFRSTDGVIDEIHGLLTDYPFLTSIHFEDDIFPLRRKWLKEFLEKYRQQVGIPFSSNIIPSLMNEEVARELSEAGCSMLQMGIESGNDYIRKEILKRPIERDQLVHAFGLCKKYGIRTMAFNMVGIPFETPASFLDTIKLNAETRPDLCQISIVNPFPSTKMYEICEANGLLSKRTVRDYFSHSPLDLPGLSDDRVTFFRIYFKVLVWLYSILFRLPGNMRGTGIAMLDRILCTRLNLDPIYEVMNGSYRLFENIAKRIRNRVRSLRIRRAVKGSVSEGRPDRGHAENPGRERIR